MKVKTITTLLLTLIAAFMLSACVSQPLQTSEPTPVETQPIPTEMIPTVTALSLEPPAPTEVPHNWVAFIGDDGNVWMVNASGGEQVQITTDAAGYSTDIENQTTVIQYQGPQWSSDGLLLAYEQQVGEPIDSGYSFQHGLWVYNLDNGQASQILQDEQAVGFDWKPGTHNIAYGQPFDPNYFARHGTEPTLAKGLAQIDVDSREKIELVQPERGLHLVAPVWSPDGRFLSFQEVYLMEGSGKFGFYDFESGEYIAWDEPIGGYSWGRNGETIAYDLLTYVAQGTEAIWVEPREGGDPTRLSLQIDNGFAYSPVYSPEGDRLVYLADLDGLDANMATLFVVDAAVGEPRELGTFDSAGYLSWTADGYHLLMTRGPWDNSEILLLSTTDGSLRVLAVGSQPAWNPGQN